MKSCLRLLLALLVIPAMALPSRAATYPSASQPLLLEDRDSTYNRIYVYKSGPDYILNFGHNKRFYTESIFDSSDELALPVPYTQYMTVGLAYTPKASNILEIGFGGGRTAWYLHKQLPASNITSVELDPVVYELAQKYFGIHADPGFGVEVGDGRIYLQKNQGPWDIIMIDAYRGPFVPFHLLTHEFFALVKSRLAPGGVAIQNVEPTTMLFDSAVATIRSVFDNVEAYESGGNIVVVAYDGKQIDQSALAARAAELKLADPSRYPLSGLIEARRVMMQTPNATVLTDDFAPVESLLAIERHNKKLDQFSEAPPK